MTQSFVEVCTYMDKHFYNAADYTLAHTIWTDFGKTWSDVVQSNGKLPHYLHMLLKHPDHVAVANFLTAVMTNCQGTEKNNGQDKAVYHQCTRLGRAIIQMGNNSIEVATAIYEMMAYHHRCASEIQQIREIFHTSSIPITLPNLRSTNTHNCATYSFDLLRVYYK
jgi:hypothetical protein